MSYTIDSARRKKETVSGGRGGMVKYSKVAKAVLQKSGGLMPPCSHGTAGERRGVRWGRLHSTARLSEMVNFAVHYFHFSVFPFFSGNHIVRPAVDAKHLTVLSDILRWPYQLMTNWSSCSTYHSFQPCCARSCGAKTIILNQQCLIV